ncbi:hypothetical protein I4U23_002631 [Adineta vaga]|nr:hypothetical protein I4U23_002631 [Adineta vaga]
MNAAGFEYTDSEDTARCNICGLEVSGWIVDMKPFTIHAQRSPTCDFVRSMIPEGLVSTFSNLTYLSTDDPSNDHDENPPKRKKLETSQWRQSLPTLIEVDKLQQIRKRTFSHWPQGASPSSAQMIDAGFFNCNVGDRVMCLYCNIICQQWTRHTDDPCEVHKTLSPKCPYVIAMMKRQQTASIIILNEYPTNENSAGTFRYNELVHTAACHPSYIEIPQRYSSFETWPKENLPCVDNLVRAGFFYTGTKTIVTCFYCNGSLQNWGANDNPMIEHARWFPNCAYAKQLCGAELYKKIQESKKSHEDRNTLNDRQVVRGLLNIPDENFLSRLVAARLDLIISQRLLDQNHRLSIIKRCWEDQLRIKHDDFVDDCDLLVSCIILQKQIIFIDGKKENILIPSQAINSSPLLNSSTTNTDVDMSTSSESVVSETNLPTSENIGQKNQNLKASVVNTVSQDRKEDPQPSNPCVLCLTEEKKLACIPCGHLATCVSCGHSLRVCPVCRREIEAFVRIYL